MTVTIYYNPDCGTSRNARAMIEASGERPEIIAYLERPPSPEALRELLARLGMTPRELLRAKEAKADALGLHAADVTDAALIEAMAAHPILINRPVVVVDDETGQRADLCRPSERVLDLLSHPVARFTKEDGEIVSAADPAV